ncbi:sterol o-acyltransferase (APE2), putative [Paecilomyces variotii No. 5]|uniref:O-acyltransferase n=1 Tax=Byssochlamys spectabilis (strain No. 5 / NBRC 109023) TaxID=1356009 RepID=V5FFU9_BYSSN|nr:sterol o-acyltransferase (APE2), putative [Paecilomyces variotii No. 5]
MSTSVGNGSATETLRSRNKASHKSEEQPLAPPFEKLATEQSSGTSTPVPEDAPPSVHSLSSARKQVRARRRLFYTIDYVPRVSHFDPESDYHDFHGFFTLFWIGLFIMVVTTMLRNIKDTGYPMRVQVLSLLTANVWQLALSDLAMVATTGVTIPLHHLFRTARGGLRWSQGGMVIQSLYQFAWLCLWVSWPFLLGWAWTAQVFFTLHTLVLLMKMHSYAFYNGHLSETQRRLASLDKPESASMDAAVRYPRVSRDGHVRSESQSERPESVSQLREDLATELTSPLGNVTYPRNLSVRNYVDYLFCPTLCYELEYPRTERIRWSEVFFKTLAVFGCISLLTLITEEFMLPVLDEASVQLQVHSSAVDQGLILAETISMLLFPFMLAFLLVFLVIFEYVLGAFAEITRFADRRFYSDWWNSCDWLEFSREWNIPVHHFLRRHVYFSSKTHFSSSVSMFITFLVSSIAHELVMACITKKLRGYGFLTMMLQLPIIAIQRSKFIRGRRVLNNVCFWSSMIMGLSMMCALYVLV